jgi:hypothetical protein
MPRARSPIESLLASFANAFRFMSLYSRCYIDAKKRSGPGPLTKSMSQLPTKGRSTTAFPAANGEPGLLTKRCNERIFLSFPDRQEVTGAPALPPRLVAAGCGAH